MPIVTIDNHNYIARLTKSRLRRFVSVSKRFSLPNGRIDWNLAGIKLAMDNVLPIQCLNPANLSKMYHRLTKPQRIRKGRAGGHSRTKESLGMVRMRELNKKIAETVK